MLDTLKNHKTLVIIFAIFFIIALTVGIYFIASFISKVTDEDENLIYVNDVLQEITVDSEDDVLLIDEDTIGTLEIPKINLNAIVKEGTEKDVIDNYIGHFTNSSIFEGNVALAAHNRGVGVKHYFGKINELNAGDEIIYNTKLGTKQYQVKEKKEISSYDWDVVEKENKKVNTITLITCVANQADKRLCVVAEENTN